MAAIKILYLPDGEVPLISITADEIQDFVDNIDDYSGVTVIETLNCTETPITQTYDTTDVLDNTKLFYIDEDTNTLYISSQLLSGATSFVDGIYKFDVKFNNASGYVLIQNCIFIDITYKCKVAALMQNIIKENEKVKDTEKVSTIIHLLHYSLVNGSNCGCNCDEMCEVFRGLQQLLLDIDPQILNDCGC